MSARAPSTRSGSVRAQDVVKVLKAVKRGGPHPIQRFLEAGVLVALCCDNTTVSRTDAVRESLIAAEQIGLEAVVNVHRSALDHTFIRPDSALADEPGGDL